MYDELIKFSSSAIGFAWFLSPILFMLYRRHDIQKHVASNAITASKKTEKEKKDAKAASIVLEDYEVFNMALERFNSYCSRQCGGLKNDDSAGAYKHQVAGHTREVIRSLGAGLIMKPMMKKDLFLREVALYEEMNSTSASYITTPLPFVPDYYGITMAPATNGDQELLPFMVLKDLNCRYRNPCVIDIKMGQQTYEPTASAAKIARELHKYPYQEEVGFRVTGHKVWDIVSESYRSYDKKLGRNLHPSFVKDCLASFIYNGVFFRRDVVVCILQQLQRILRWMRRQTRYHFYCSSILIVYDGNVLRDDARQRYLRSMGCRPLAAEGGAIQFDDEHLKCRHFVDRLRCRRERLSLRKDSDGDRSGHSRRGTTASPSMFIGNRSATNSCDEANSSLMSSSTPAAAARNLSRTDSRMSEASNGSDGAGELLLKSPVDLSESGRGTPTSIIKNSGGGSSRRSRCDSSNSTDGGAGGSSNPAAPAPGVVFDDEEMNLAPNRIKVEYYGHDDNAAEQSYKNYLRTHPTMFLPQSTDPEDLVQVKIIDLAHSISTGSDELTKSLLPLVTLDGGGNKSSSAPECACGDANYNGDSAACDSAASSAAAGQAKNAEIISSLGGVVDHGYIHGLVTLIKMFEDIVVAIDSNAEGTSLTEGIAALLTSEDVIDILPQ